MRSTAFFSAFLLFQVELIAGKSILPNFGGGPGVWITCLLFFQVSLLLGYVYAYGLIQFVPRWQYRVHVLIVCCVCLWLLGQCFFGGGMLPDNATHLQDVTTTPIWSIIKSLSLSIGMPFILLSATTTLLQSRIAARTPPGEDGGTREVFRLFAYSNAGAFLGLLTYPSVVEPSLGISLQWRLWRSCFLLYAVAFIVVFRPNGILGCRNNCAAGSSGSGAEPLEGWRVPIWIVLAAIPSLLLMATTSHLTVNVAPIPLLWVSPLLLYLATFVICFSGKWEVRPEMFGVGVLVSAIGCTILGISRSDIGVGVQIPVYCAALLFASLFCHSCLYACRPQPSRAALFNLSIAFGGVLGGLVASVVAPTFFRDYWEFALALRGAMLCSIVVWMLSRSSWMKSWRLPFTATALATMVIMPENTGSGDHAGGPWRNEEGSDMSPCKQELVARERNFFGALKVWRRTFSSGGHATLLVNGTIFHGYQYDGHPRRRHATAYYAQDTGIGLLMEALDRRMTAEAAVGASGPSGMRVAGLGMGIGTIAAYARGGDVFRFYEINPAVISLATNSSLFSYIGDSDAKTEIVEGDARMSLERERREGLNGRFDLIVLDTFSGDAIPFHLLTVEAMNLYLNHLNTNGVIAAHITNKYLNLVPVFAAIKRRTGLMGTVVVTKGDRKMSLDAAWVILARNSAVLKDPELNRLGRNEMETCPNTGEWTDDYSSIWSVLRL